MVRYADMEMAVMKEEVYTHGFLETGMARKAGPQAEVPGLVKEAEGARETEARAFTVASMGRNRQRQGEQAEDWLV